MTARLQTDDDRVNAARAVAQVLMFNRTIDWVLQAQPQWIATPLARELVYGSLRHYYSLSETLEGHLTKPLRSKDQDIKSLLLVGAYQLLHTRIPDHAAINETVNACKKLKKPWAKGLVNAVLRAILTARTKIDAEAQRVAIQAESASAADPDYVVGPDQSVGSTPGKNTGGADGHTLADHTAGDLSLGDHSLEEIESGDIDTLQARFELPAWLINKVAEQYPQRDALLESARTRAPMTLRINTTRTTCPDYLERLRDADIDFIPTHLAEAVTLSRPQPAETLPRWSEGEIAVQDLGAMLVARIALSAMNAAPADPPADQPADQPATRILDACCAPGGKLCHLLQLLADDDPNKPTAGPESSNPHRTELHLRGTHLRDSHLRDLPSLDPAPPDPVDQDPAASDIVVTHQVTGLDVSQRRLSTTRAITKRLGQDHHITLLEGDATTDNWWDGTPYSHILLDAPCSGSGTWRRNPDLKVLLREDSLLGHQQLQLKLLNNLWCMLDSTGSLLYCTCSILQEENDQVIRQFLAHQQTALQQPHVVGIDLPTGHATEFGWQLLPTDRLTDGFYFAVLSKSQHATTERLRL